MEKCMRIRVECWADSSERAHTVRKCSLVQEIIQHVEYPAPMAGWTKIAENGTTHLRKQLRQFSRVTLSSADSSNVPRALQWLKYAMNYELYMDTLSSFAHCCVFFTRKFSSSFLHFNSIYCIQFWVAQIRKTVSLRWRRDERDGPNRQQSWRVYQLIYMSMRFSTMSLEIPSFPYCSRNTTMGYKTAPCSAMVPLIVKMLAFQNSAHLYV